MTNLKVLIGGGTGFIGRRLGDLISKHGYDVTNVSRMPGRNNICWSDIAMRGLPDNTHAVVNLAGQQFMDFTKAWTPGFKQNIQNSRVFTTKSLVEAINKAEAKPKVLVVVTGVGAYEPSEYNKYDESSVVTGSDFFSRLTIEWEGAASKVDPSVRLVIIRSGVVIGREGGMIKNMILPFFLGLGGRIGSGKQFLPWIHVDDLTGIIKFAIENEKVDGILNGVSPHIITNQDFTASFAKALNRPAFFPVPETILNVLLNPERAMLLTKGQHVTPKRVLELGYSYKYHNLDEACKDVAHIFPKKPAN
ncbi:epimerase family protein SDR39U1 [Cydia pomonella]|uniref:epimerase family protein SDR39U1 n=1 Tax=Cydia pomonella TaxID=82600 RepID=UPI002ADE786E|nr:epimerase family protein SDR39U1 [Cydia pomonella]XP_061715180.1 epimerase family protein SDR39U1 [Cydia pomonella]XP_061715181.1 epimerase family protein SDR39U1 [Cydia pomonella]XP_061715182.1 epimerase family protein SDR39U1 [Cydia pomonella]XP_061715183.1 epimerase family protein SDR39U1 [Cydia pomonella]